MLSRIKFRIVGGEYAGKYVCNIENGKMVFFNRYFRPQDRDGIDTCFAIMVEGSHTQIDFVGSNFLWNGKSLAPVVVTVSSGDTLTWESHSIEILDCPMYVNASSDKTKFLDISTVFKKGMPPISMEEPPARVPTAAPATLAGGISLTPIPKTGGSVIAPIPAIGEPHTSQVESSLIIPSFDSGLIAPEPQKKVVIKSTELKKTLAEMPYNPEKSFPNIQFAPAKNSEISVIPMRRSFGVMFQMATIFVVFLCFGTYVYKKLLSAQWELDKNAAMAVFQKPTLAEPKHAVAPETNSEPVRSIASTATPISEVTDGASVKKIESSATPIAPIELKANESESQAALFAAIDSNDIPTVQKLVDENHLVLDFTDSTGKTPVTQAAAMGRLSILKIFVANKADLNVKDSEGYSALMQAVMHERKSTIEFLIEQGVDRKYKRDDGKNAFAMAKEQNKDLLKLFVQHRSPSSKK